MYSINVRFGLVRFVPGLNLVRIPVGPERKVTKIERDKRKKKKKTFFSQKKKKGELKMLSAHYMEEDSAFYCFFFFLMKSSRDGTKKHHFLVFFFFTRQSNQTGSFLPKEEEDSICSFSSEICPSPHLLNCCLGLIREDTTTYTVVFLYYSIPLNGLLLFYPSISLTFHGFRWFDSRARTF